MSKKKERPFQILIIDDDSSYVESLFRRTQMHRLILQRYSNLEAAKEFMNSSEGAAICGVILDVVCMKSKDQEMADPDFIIPAFKYFSDKTPHLPRAILTGQPDRYKHLKEYFPNVYQKGRDEEEMISFFEEQVKEIPREKTIRRYIDVFEVVEKYLGYEAEERLLDCLDKMVNPELPTITGTLANIRKLRDFLYVGLNKIDNNMVPDKFIYSGNSDINVDSENIIRYLKGLYDPATKRLNGIDYIKHNSLEDRLIQYINNGTSKELHITGQRSTKYTVQSLVFAFMDLILCLKEIADKKS